jgi:two-component SAPR family response regulator
MNLKVLIVDDDEIIVVIHTILIKKSNLETSPLTFNKGKEAIDYLKKNQDNSDTYLIFLDINMPEMSGWEFLEEVNKIKNNVFIVMVTSSVNKVDKDKSLLYDKIIYFLEKPLKKEDCDNIKLLPQILKYF